MRLLVIGLDCAAPQLVFEQWADEVRPLNRLTTTGAYGRLKTTHPPITVPAWTSMMSSRAPGQLGSYGLQDRREYSYGGYAIANATRIRHDGAWDRLSR